MINFSIFKELHSMELNNFSPKLTTLSIGQEEAIKELWVSEDGKTRLGVWECTEGTFTADRTKMGEYCHIIFGTAKIFNDNDGTSQDIGPGDLLILPIGWKGRWTINSHIRKLYMLDEKIVR